jgi:hypothetical protein
VNANAAIADGTMASTNSCVGLGLKIDAHALRATAINALDHRRHRQGLPGFMV